MLTLSTPFHARFIMLSHIVMAAVIGLFLTLVPYKRTARPPLLPAENAPILLMKLQMLRH